MSECAAGEDDIIDEVLLYFKANTLFKNFEIKGPADRVLIYLTLYITQCLLKLDKCPSKADGIRQLTSMAHEQFSIPGESGFALGSFFPSPESPQEAELTRTYLKQLREETGRRGAPRPRPPRRAACSRALTPLSRPRAVLTKVFASDDGQPSKFWLVFSKRKFMNKVLT